VGPFITGQGKVYGTLKKNGRINAPTRKEKTAKI